MFRWLPQFSHKRAESGTSRASDAQGSSAGIPSNVRQAEAVDTIYQSTLRQINDLSTLCHSFVEAQGVLPTATVEKLKEEFANLHVSLYHKPEKPAENPGFFVSTPLATVPVLASLQFFVNKLVRSASNHRETLNSNPAAFADLKPRLECLEAALFFASKFEHKEFQTTATEAIYHVLLLKMP